MIVVLPISKVVNPRLNFIFSGITKPLGDTFKSKLNSADALSVGTAFAKIPQ